MSEELAVRLTNRTQSEIEQSIAIKSRSMAQIMVSYVCDIGLDLTDLREVCPHGEWGNTLNRLGFSKSLAHSWMQIYKEYGTSQTSLFAGANVQTFGSLPISKAIALLKIPADEREEFAKGVDIDHISVRALQEEVKKANAAKARAEQELSDTHIKLSEQKEVLEEKLQVANQAISQLEQAQANHDLEKEAFEKHKKELTFANQRIADLNGQLEELKNRPVDVAVRTVDATAKQLAEAEQRGKASVTGELEQLRQQLAQAEAQLAEAKRISTTAPENLARVKIVAQAQEKVLTIQTSVKSLVSCISGLDEFTAKKISTTVVQFLRQQADVVEKHDA